MTDLAPAPPPLTAEPPTRANSTKWTVRCGDVADRCNPDEVASVRSCARRLGVTEEHLRETLARARAPKILPPEAPEALPQVLASDQTTGDGPSFEGFEAALFAVGGEFLRWSDPRIAALDVDVQSPSAGFSDAEAQDAAAAPSAPPAAYSWRTKSNGLRLMFLGPKAAETAALHAILAPWSGDTRLRKVEVLAYTRRPPTGRPVYRPPEGAYDWLARLRRVGGAAAVPAEEIERYLAEHGLPAPGNRAPHTLCPIDPCPSESRDPVMVTEDGILCFRCANTRGRGWRPWAALIDVAALPDGEPDLLVEMAERYVHWEHARYPLLGLYPAFDEKWLRLGYSALLEAIHPEEPERIAAAFNRDLRFVRGSHGWLRTTDWKSHDSIGLRSMLALPFVHGSPPLADLALGSGPLPGYMPIVPVAHVVERPVFRGPWLLVPRPIPTAEPVNIPADWPAIETELLHIFEGASPLWCRTVLLLVAGALRAQFALPSPPMTLIHAPTGSGKGVAVAFATGVLGSSVADVFLQDTPAKIAEAIGDGLESGASILFADEVGKAGGMWKESAPLLSLSDTHSWRKLRVGHCTAPFTAHLVLATSTFPRGVLTLPEFRRRLGWVRLPRVDTDISDKWMERATLAFGCDSLTRLRETPRGAGLSVGMIAVAKQLMTELGSCVWRDFADRTLGVAPEETPDDPERAAVESVVIDLYQCWTDLSFPLSGPGARYRGWLDASLRGDTRVTAILERWLSGDETRDEQHAKLMRLETSDVVKICHLPSHRDIRLEARAHGRAVYVRFVEPGITERQGFPPCE